MSVSLEVTPQPHVLTIAGSDSGGGAGVQADLKTIAAFGCYGSSVITGLTAQNTLGVHAVHEVPSDFVVKQLQSVFDDSPPVALKFGMLTSSSTVSAIANYLSVQKNRPVMVLDPVMISTSGHTLLADDAIQAIKDELLPLVDWITPNIPEAMCLLGHKQESISGGLESLLDMAKKLNDLPCEVVLLKGGHLRVSKAEVMALAGKYPVIWEQGDDEQETIEFLSRYRDGKGLRQETEFVVDILLQKSTGKMTLFVGRMLESRNTHGTGCTLSAAIASTLAKHKMANGDQPYDAVSICRTAIEYTRSAISSAFEFGQGHGPLNHSHLTAPRALPPPTKHNPHPFMSYLIQSDLPLWQSYVKHPFVVQLGDGTLPVECFEHYIKQDYHYLRHYARAHALGAYKSSSFEDISAFTGIAAHIARESQMHVDYCAEFGISLPQLMSTPESPACSAYARYILDIGAQGDVLDLYLAVASCLVGYGEVGLWLQKRVREGEAKMVGNRYKKWMEDYAGKEFLDAVDRGIDNLESRIALDPPSPAKLERLVGIWHNVVRLEKEFWDMGLSRT